MLLWRLYPEIVIVFSTIVSARSADIFRTCISAESIALAPASKYYFLCCLLDVVESLCPLAALSLILLLSLGQTQLYNTLSNPFVGVRVKVRVRVGWVRLGSYPVVRTSDNEKQNSDN